MHAATEQGHHPHDLLFIEAQSSHAMCEVGSKRKTQVRPQLEATAFDLFLVGLLPEKEPDRFSGETAGLSHVEVHVSPFASNTVETHQLVAVCN
jgi:hypothetical protein